MTQADVDAIAALLDTDTRLGQEPWDRYAYFIYVGEDVVSSSGFRFVENRWYPGPAGCFRQIRKIMGKIRDEGDLPIPDRWNAAVVTVTRHPLRATLHIFHDLAAEAWDMTPANQPDIARRAARLFGDHFVARQPSWASIRIDHGGLKGRSASLPAASGDTAEQSPEFLAAEDELVIIDEAPLPDGTVRVYAPQAHRVASVQIHQLAVRDG